MYSIFYAYNFHNFIKHFTFLLFLNTRNYSIYISGTFILHRNIYVVCPFTRKMNVTLFSS